MAGDTETLTLAGMAGRCGHVWRLQTRIAAAHDPTRDRLAGLIGSIVTRGKRTARRRIVVSNKKEVDAKKPGVGAAMARGTAGRNLKNLPARWNRTRSNARHDISTDCRPL